MRLDSDAETERNDSGESTVEESPHDRFKKRKQTPKPKKVSSAKSQDDGSIIDLILGKLPPKATNPYNENREEVFCICRGVDNGDLMVACDGCDEWYHFKCMKIDKRYEPLTSNYYCPYCQVEGKGKTLWKRKCRLESCFKPISGNDSKYCSKAHGLQYLKSVVFNKLPNQDRTDTLDKDKLVQLVEYSTNILSFKTLGNCLPEPPIQFDDDPAIKRIERNIKSLKAARDIEVNRKRLLIKTRENIKKLNEELTNDSVSEFETISKKKSKVKKIDVCGYDFIFRSAETHVDEKDLFSNNTETLIAKFKELQDTEEQPIDVKICLLEKRKCFKHNGWQSMINDEIDMNVDKIDAEIEFLVRKKDKLIKTMTIDYFEA